MTQQRCTLAESWGSVSLSGVYLVVRGEAREKAIAKSFATPISRRCLAVQAGRMSDMTRLRPGLARGRELLRKRRDLGAQALGLLVGQLPRRDDTRRHRARWAMSFEN